MQEPYSVRFDPNIPLMLRDGTITYVDVFRPDASGRFPALLQRTPYDKSAPLCRSGMIDPVRAAMNGYGVVIQDVRGRYTSNGDFYAFVNEIDDGYDSVEWVASREWCTGKVGMYGPSYIGATQWLAAKSRPPSLTAIAPMVTASDYHEGWAWQGGAFELGFNLSWAMGSLVSGNWANLSSRLFLSDNHLDALINAKDNLTAGYRRMPMRDLPDLIGGLAPYYYDWLDHPEYDDYWKRISIEESHHEIQVPALNIGGWYDIFLGGTISNFVRMRAMAESRDARRGQRLIIGPWVHSAAPDKRFGRVQLRHPIVQPGDGPAGHRAQVLQPLAQGRGQRRPGRQARPHLRHGQERLAGRGTGGRFRGPWRRSTICAAGAGPTR